MIRIYPKYYLNSAKFANLISKPLPKNFLWGEKPFLFFENAKGGIHYIAKLLGLQRNDEVFITTSSDFNYVSTCVSATLFNYAKISRVLTDKTKLIYVIHELGVPNLQLHNLLIEAKKRSIPLLEDCAHGIEAFIGNNRIGTLGDFALYSLPKQLPLDFGGLLVGNELPTNISNYDSNIANYVEKDFFRYLPYLSSLSEARRENFAFMREKLSVIPTVLEYEDIYTPYTLNLFTSFAKNLYKELAGNIAEWLPVYIDNWFCIPTQPLMEEQDMLDIVAAIHSIIKKATFQNIVFDNLTLSSTKEIG